MPLNDGSVKLNGHAVVGKIAGQFAEEIGVLSVPDTPKKIL